MKKITIATQHNLSQQLDLGKETIANLTAEQLREIEGGAAANDCGFSCFGSNSCHVGVTEQTAGAE